ncbi:unnamed protein product [Bursaphelenchus xylophilus]|uniref:(pine wood nematode) hypothetical protein n=1 Tax=Bursaphelenchus xylophilus TaxID=6326 RepID=A0A1I7SCK0_BURXY|nr:unnamed protein product [Bursaphelenchus xylophilus]CAG9093966.1 unnamed protein product [Bursaphelenchus xylophilus]
MRSVLVLALLAVAAHSAVLQQPQAVVVEADDHEWDMAKAEIQAAIDKLKAELYAERQVELAAAASIRGVSMPKTLKSEYLDVEGNRFLCKPCNFLFSTIKEELIKETRLELETIRPKVNEACLKWSHNVSFLDRVCEKLVDRAIVELAKWLRAEEKKIDPERICTFLHMC